MCQSASCGITASVSGCDHRKLNLVIVVYSVKFVKLGAPKPRAFASRACAVYIVPNIKCVGAAERVISYVAGILTGMSAQLLPVICRRARHFVVADN